MLFAVLLAQPHVHLAQGYLEYSLFTSCELRTFQTQMDSSVEILTPLLESQPFKGLGFLARQGKHALLEAPKIQSGIKLSVSAVESGDLSMSVCGIVTVVETIC